MTPEDTVIDATCGNGQDTLFLAKLRPRRLYGLDIQETALDNTRKLLYENNLDAILLNTCHSRFPDELEPHSVKLIVYNLGYLPGSNKEVTTCRHTTMRSLEQALLLITSGGAVSVTCYPGHPEGAQEEARILDFAAELDKTTWSCCHQRWLNRNKAPNLLIIQHKQST